MSNASPQEKAPVYTVSEDIHRFCWADGTRIEVQRVILDHYERLFGDLYAYAGDNLLNHTQGNLLDDGTRQRFATACASADGGVAWAPRVLLATHHVSKELRGDIQSSRAFWQDTLTVPEFLASPLATFADTLVQDLVYPRSITFVASPRGLGKSNVATVLALALAQGGRFRDQALQAARVLLLDRDNPSKLVQDRLRH